MILVRRLSRPFQPFVQRSLSARSCRSVNGHYPPLAAEGLAPPRVLLLITDFIRREPINRAAYQAAAVAQHQVVATYQAAVPQHQVVAVSQDQF
jgi:hypothetical protein